MLVALCTLIALTIQTPESTVVLRVGVRSPAYSSSGRLAFELRGDLWVMDLAPTEAAASPPSNSGLIQITSGPAWDREPAWMPDGKSIVFSSDRAGGFDLWSIAIGEDGGVGEPQRLTDSPEREGEPAVGPEGAIVFVRGRNATADLWIRSTDGDLRRLTTRRGAERSPTFSPDGKQLAYVSELHRRRQLRLYTFEDEGDEVLIANMQVEHPAWSPRRDVIAFATRGRRGGVWLTPLDGRYTNLVSTNQAMAAWSPDGEWLALAELPPSDPGYNGDPDRVGDRQSGDMLASQGRLWLVRVPLLPDAAISEIPVEATADRTAYNAERFDRLWDRMNRLYYQRNANAEWTRLRAKYRPRALSATADSALDEVTYRMLRERPPMRPEVSGKAGVSSANPHATAAGVEILRKGGNVIDAAVAVSFAIGVVEPDASGVGGYGEMVLYLDGMDEPVVIEFLTRVPEQAGLSNAALLENGSLPPDGPVLANVPGTVAGMWQAWKEYGSGELKWSELVQPAIGLAEEGFVLDDAFTTTLALERNRFLKYESSKKLFFPDGEPLEAGDTLRNPDLAWTLRQIADSGADAFYKGGVAKRLVADLRGQGNAMTLNDLARYFAVEREPVSGIYHGHTIYSAAPAAGGGASLIAKLNLLDQIEQPGLYTDDAATLHAMIEAWKLTPSLFGRIADPSLWPVDLTAALDKEAAHRRWQQCFDPERSTGPAELRRDGDELACEESDEVELSWGEELFNCDANDERGCRASGTTAFAVADAQGNFVAVTQTLGTWGGNFYVSPGLGFLYNDKLRSYRTNPSAYGARLPYARHGTSIAPTLVFKGTGDRQRPLLAVGAAGNAWITSAVYQIVAATIDRELGPQQALELPRFLVGVQRDGGEVRDIIIQIEDGFAPHVMRRLTGMGHKFQRISLRGELRMGYGAAVLIDGGLVRAGGDPRRSGAAGAIP